MKIFIQYKDHTPYKILPEKKKIYQQIAKRRLEVTEFGYHDNPEQIEIIEINPKNTDTVEVIIMQKSQNIAEIDNYEIWILEINKKDKEKLSAWIHNFDEYETFKKVKLLLHKKEVELPIIIKKHQKNDYQSLTLKHKANLSQTYHYHKEQHNYIQEKTKEEQHLINILQQHIFQPIEGKYLTGEEKEYRIKNTEKELYQATKNNPQLLRWLLNLENYEKEDSYGSYSSIKILCLKLIKKIDKKGDILYQISANKNTETYLRYRAIDYLNQEKNREQIKKLIYLVSSEQYEVLSSILNAIANNHITEALETIKRAYPNSKKIEILETRAKLGDKSVLKTIIAEQNNPWYKERVNRAINALVEQIGDKEALTQLLKYYQTNTIKEQYQELYQKSRNQEIRYWTITRQKNLTPTELINILNDDNWSIQEYIAKQLIEHKEKINQALISTLDNKKVKNHAKHWIIYILIQRGEDTTALIQQVADIKIKLPNYISDKMRKEIIKEWYTKAQPKTDIRWIIEGYLLEKEVATPKLKEEEVKYKKEIWSTGCSSIKTIQDKEEKNNQHETLKKELIQHNIEIKENMDYAQSMGTGFSTFDIITLSDFTKEPDEPLDEDVTEIYNDELYLSKIGNYAIAQTKYTSFYKGETQSSGDHSINQKREKLYQQILEKTGYTYVSPKERNFIFPELNIYFFGNRKELSIFNLLFYWQD